MIDLSPSKIDYFQVSYVKMPKKSDSGKGIPGLRMIYTITKEIKISIEMTMKKLIYG